MGTAMIRTTALDPLNAEKAFLHVSQADPSVSVYQ